MLRLWAPWRSPYMRVAGKSRRCIFCFGKLSAPAARRRLVLYAGPLATVMLNRYPYNNGHIMIAPRRHLASPELLTREERVMIGEITALAVARMRRVLKPAGFNLGANLGRTAGAGFADHVHWHVVPRWEGDTNFMAALAGARVLSQHLDESFETLAPLFKTIEVSIS
ncbi:MAG: HIT domain-containing protein [Candidatus Binataceae bacterium]